MNTLPAATGGCGVSGGGCSDGAMSPSVTATAGPAPAYVWADDQDTAKAATEATETQ